MSADTFRVSCKVIHAFNLPEASMNMITALRKLYSVSSMIMVCRFTIVVVGTREVSSMIRVSLLLP